MSKKNKETAGFITEQEEKVSAKTKREEAKIEKDSANVKGKRVKAKKPNVFVRFGKKCKEIFAELKRVTWPTWNKVLKNTGTVLAVVLVFLVVITLYDFGLAALFDLLKTI